MSDRTGALGTAYVTGLQSGRRRNTSEKAIAKVSATCKHFAAFGSPQGGMYVLCTNGIHCYDN